MRSFTFNGRKYVNGYACDALGRPITIKNGYSSEDERDSRQDYLDTLELMKTGPIKSNLKYARKSKINQTPNQELLEMYEEEYRQSRRKSKDGYMLNDAGEKISIENGYSDIDEKFAKRQVKTLHL